jgi:hypothetical protein
MNCWFVVGVASTLLCTHFLATMIGLFLGASYQRRSLESALETQRKLFERAGGAE